jgi:hypothetical protein
MHSSYSFLISALDWGEWSASRPSCALPPLNGPQAPTGYEDVWVSRADLDTEARVKILCL